MTNAKEIATESKTAKFEVGKNYYANFYTAGFAEVAEKNTVIKRTAKTVTFQNDKTGETFKRNIRMSCGGEVCKAYGKFLVLRADQCIEENIEAEIEDYAVKPEAFDIAVECEIENAKATEVETKKASRKVITRDDLNSFCFRLEKVSNGQFGALVEVQKKAVALLGTEIPESVYKADNSYHAFHIWLGSEINPVIVYSDGNKDEIRVCGDAYGFVAVKEETPEDKPAEVEKTSDNATEIATEIATEKSYIEQLNRQKIYHAENLVNALESFDARIESGAGIKSLENAARKIDCSVKQIEEINRNIAAHEKRIADLEKEETSDVAKFKVGGIYKNEVGTIYEVVKRSAKQMYIKLFDPVTRCRDPRRVRIETGTGIGDEWTLFDDCHLGANGEMTHADAINYCFKRCFEIFKESQNDLKRYITEKKFRYAECVKNMVIMYRKKLLEMKNAA